MNNFAFEEFPQLNSLTYLKYEHVFICDETGEEIITQKYKWEVCVCTESERLRYRPTHNTRHTYRCMLNQWVQSIICSFSAEQLYSDANETLCEVD